MSSSEENCDRLWGLQPPLKKKRYKLWKEDPNIEIPLSTIHRWRTNIKRSNGISALLSELRDVGSEPSNHSTKNEGFNDEMTIPFDYECDGDHCHNFDIGDTIDDPMSRVICDLLYDNSELTVAKGILTTMKFYIEHRLTKRALQVFLSLMQKFLPKPNYLPVTNYYIFKIIEKFSPPCKFVKHYYCKECLFYNNTNAFMEICPSCNGREGTSFFFELDIIDQLRNLFENRNLADKLKVNPNESNIVSDITDGTEYLRINSRQERGQYDLTLIMNTDGISLSNSSRSNCWPIMFMIAELPEYLRETCIIIMGIWFDTSQKPLMNTFLQPICSKLITCFTDGITWIHPVTNETCVSKIVAPLFIADAPARAQILNVVSFKGKFGCNICEIKTQRSLKMNEERRTRVYAFRDPLSRLRTKHRMLKYAKEALDRKVSSIKGIKGKSALSSLPLLDLSTCVIPEYMHSVLLGVVKQILSLWMTKKIPFRVIDHIQEIDNLLMNIQPLDSFNRMPQKLSDYPLYKASEFYNFLLFYSIPTLVDYLPEQYFQHWLLLVISVFNLLGKKILINPTLEVTEILLKIFVEDVESLYGDKAYTYNIHQLLHLTLSVRRWGPLWATSAFPFENYNNFIANCVHGTKHLGQEMVNKLRRIQAVQNFDLQYCRDENPCTKSNNKSRKYQLFNKVRKITCCNAETNLIESISSDWEIVVFYERARIDNLIYTSQIYKTIKTNNFTIQVKVNDTLMYGSIRYFLEIEGKIYFMLQRLKVEHSQMFYHRETQTLVKHILPIKETGEFSLINVTDVQCMSHLIRVRDYVCKPPNQMNKIM